MRLLRVEALGRKDTGAMGQAVERGLEGSEHLTLEKFCGRAIESFEAFSDQNSVKLQPNS